MTTNNKVSMSKHALQRAQQRAIPEAMLSLLCTLGAECQQKGGTSLLFIPKKQRCRIRRQLQQLLSRFDAIQDSYLVMNDDGHIITTGHLHS